MIDAFEYPVRRAIGQEYGRLNIVIKQLRVAILSHSCDLRPSKRQSFIFAPLLPVPSNIRRKPSDYELLKSMEIPDRPSFINLFLYEAAPELDNNEYVIDFATMQSAPLEFCSSSRGKLLELSAEAREFLKRKLAVHFARAEEA